MTVRVRLAPSPTGTLHIGTARTALFNWLFARNKQGKFLIRIEDTDKERSKAEHIENIFEGLKWLGLTPDERPIVQSERIEAHKAAIKLLLDKGLAYRCYASESELEAMRANQIAQGKAPKYDNRHRDLSNAEIDAFKKEGRSAVVRFRINDQEEIVWNDLVRGPLKWKGSDLGGDMVISRRSSTDEIGDPLYNLVVVVDDSYMEITHVIRGEDHIANTAKQILLYKALGLVIPNFAHTPLILNSEGRKLSKRDGVTSINDFREKGYTPQAMANYMTLLGWSVPEGMNERFSIEEVVSFFTFERVNKAGAKFDWDKLNWLNSQVIHSWTPEVLFDELKNLWVKEEWELPDKDWCISLAELIGPSMTLLNDGVTEARPFFEEPPLEEQGRAQLEVDGVTEAIKSLIGYLDQTPWDGIDKNIGIQILSEVAKSVGVKKGLLMKGLRAALLGKMQGPDLMTAWGLLARIRQDRQRLRSRI